MTYQHTTDQQLNPFFEPDRVHLVTDGSNVTPSESTSWAYPRVPQDRIPLSELRSTDAIGPNDLVVLALPLETLGSALPTIDRTPGTAVLIPTGGRLRPDGGPSGVAVEWEWEPTGLATTEDWEELRAAIEETDARVLGPGASVRVPAPDDGSQDGRPTAGRAAIVLDDGTVAESVAEHAGSTGVEVGPIVGIGAGIDVGCGEVLRTLADRGGIDLVLGRSGPPDAGCVHEIRSSETDTPIAVTAVRGSPIETAMGGTVAGESVARTLMEQAGAVPVDSLERIIDSAPALAGQPVPDPGSVMVISNAGGPAVMAIDAVGASGMDVARPERETIERIDAVIPEHGSARNPLDLLADSDIEVYETVLEAALEDENVGAAVVISAPSALFTFERVAEIIADTSREYDKPLVTSLMGGERTEPALEILHDAGIPNYFDPYRAVGALDLLRGYGDTIDHRHREPSPPRGYEAEELDDVISQGPSVRLQGSNARTFVRNLGVRSVGTGPDEGISGTGVSKEPGTGSEKGLRMHLEARRNGTRGPVVLTGIAEFVGTVGDLSLRAAPLTRGDAEEMLQDLRGSDLFGGVRGTSTVALDPLLDAIVGMSHLLADEPALNRIRFPGLRVTDQELRVPVVAIDPA